MRSSDTKSVLKENIYWTKNLHIIYIFTNGQIITAYEKIHLGFFLNDNYDF